MTTQTNQTPMSFTGSMPQVPAQRFGSGVVMYLILGLVFIAIVAGCLVAIVGNAKKAGEQASEEKAKFEREYFVNVSSMNVDETLKFVGSDASDDDSRIHFSLFTTPKDAEIYRDGEWIGNSDLEDVELEQSYNEEQWLVTFPGYEPSRFTLVPNGDRTSETIVLDKLGFGPSSAGQTAKDPGKKTTPPKDTPKKPNGGLTGVALPE